MSSQLKHICQRTSFEMFIPLQTTFKLYKQRKKISQLEIPVMFKRQLSRKKNVTDANCKKKYDQLHCLYFITYNFTIRKPHE